MNTPEAEPARYLPPDLADLLRQILSTTADPDLRARLTAAMETAFHAGHASGWDRGFLDGTAEREAQLRQADILGSVAVERANGARVVVTAGSGS